MKIKLLFLIFLIYGVLYSAEFKIYGTVYINENTPAKEATILVKKNNLLIAFTETNQKGEYNIIIDRQSIHDEIEVTVRYLGYEDQIYSNTFFDKMDSNEIRLDVILEKEKKEKK